MNSKFPFGLSQISKLENSLSKFTENKWVYDSYDDEFLLLIKPKK